MDTFKKIYRALIFMTILSLSYLCLVSLNVIKPNLADETTFYIITTAVSIFIMSILFSRAANVISNRNARVIGYIATLVGLINLLLVALRMIIHNNQIITSISNIMLYVTIFIFLIVLVFEIPRSNTAHGKFQIITAIIIAITAVFPYITGLNKINNDIIFSTNSNIYELDESNTENKETLKKINIVLTFVSIGAFLLNPMLRVYYIDQDYVSLSEIDDALKSATKYQEIPQTDPYEILSDKYKKDVTEQKTPEIMENHLPPPMISESKPYIQDLPHQKVINEQFHPEELPEAIIPSIGGIPETEQPTNVVETVTENPNPIPENAVQQTPNILEAAIQPQPTPAVQNQPVETIPNPLETAVQPEAVKTPETTNNQ